MRALDTLDLIDKVTPRIAVIGDYMLDGWWTGEVERLAREAPAPVFEVRRRREQPGGAGNAAANLVSLGCRVEAVGILGDDAPGVRLRSMLSKRGIDTGGFVICDTPTRQKNRLVSADQLLLRVDEGSDEPGAGVLTGLVARAQAAIAEAHAVLICDYGSRTMLALAERLASLGGVATRARPLVVDAHDPGRWQMLAPDVVTPNAVEAATALGVAAPERDRAGFFADVAPRLHRVTGANTVVVTLDREGAIALTAGRATRTHAHPAAEQHASGAGDVFAAAMTAALASGSTVDDAVDFAQGASDVAVHKSGTSLCTAMDLAAWFDAGPLPVVSRATLLSEIEERRAAGERIVFTNGCFDVLHSGHTHYLRQAKRLGDVLVVALNDDDSVRRLKGPDRPINGVVDRARVLSALACVDYVTTFSEDSPVGLLSAVRPDVYVKGGDYSPEMLEEAGIVRAAGGEVVIVDYVADHSTTALVKRIQAGRHQANT